jgi:uncharacterized protein YqeY
MPPQNSEGTERPEVIGDIRTRMRRGLVDAMKARDQQAVAALRSALARIDNAEAVDPESIDPESIDDEALDEGVFDPEEDDAELFDAAGFDDEVVDDEAVDAGPAPYRDGRHPAVAGSVPGVGAAEVDRRVLTPEETAAIVRDDAEEREVAADVLERVGRPDQAERLRAQAKLLTTYLDPPAPPSA